METRPGRSLSVISDRLLLVIPAGTPATPAKRQKETDHVAVLVLFQGDSPPQVVELRGDRVILGRHPNCQIMLENPAISRHHAQLLNSHGAFYLEDLRSRNGTFLNGEPIEGRTELRSGDSIKICDAVARFYLVLPAEYAEAPRSTDSSRVNKVPPADKEVHKTTLPGKSQPTDKSAELRQALTQPPKESSSIVSILSATPRPGSLRLTVKPEVKLNAILEISQALKGELDLDLVLPKFLNVLFRIFPQADQAFFVIRESSDGATEKFVPRATLTRRESEGTPDPVKISQSVLRAAIDSGEPVLSSDLADDSRFSASSSITGLQLRSVMCVPLVSATGGSVGAIQVATTNLQQEFREEDLELLVSVASQAALAVENAILHKELLERRDLQRDLDFATQVQLGFLPNKRPRLADYTFYDYYEPALHVGGDYFDYVNLPGNRVAITVGDVAGKGVPAALLMARLYSSARYHILQSESVAEAVTDLNAEISTSGLGHRFITFLLMLLDGNKHTVTISNAGHLPPLERRSDGSVVSLGRAESGLPLGIVPDFVYKEISFPIAPGSSLIAFTDGVTEAMNEARQVYGRPRLESCVKRLPSQVEVMIKGIVADVEKFTGEGPARDDTCIVGFHRSEPPKPAS